MSEKIVTDASLLYIKRNYRCPVCGYETSAVDEGLVISGIDTYSGTYCMRCWAKLIHDSVTQMVPIDELEENGKG